MNDGRQDDERVDSGPEEMYEDLPPYAPASSLDSSQLRRALTDLNLLGDDPFLRMQAFNLGMIDGWLTGLEQGVLKALVREDGTPLPEAGFLSAQSQMWLFAAYELIRTWRQRCRDMIKWSESGGFRPKLSELERNLGYPHFGREAQAIDRELGQPFFAWLSERTGTDGRPIGAAGAVRLASPQSAEEAETLREHAAAFVAERYPAPAGPDPASVGGEAEYGAAQDTLSDAYARETAAAHGG